MSDQIENAETVKGRLSIIARESWEKARQCNSFVEAADLYSKLMLEAIYTETPPQ